MPSDPVPQPAMPTDEERDEMFSYYEARADEYESFYHGQGQAISALADQYPIDTAAVARLLAGFGRGHVVDLACGTGFWLSSYGRNCSRVTLVDQSASMLARARQRVETLGLQSRTETVHGDVFEVALPEAAFDGGVVGFLLSHLTDPQTETLFGRLRAILRPEAELAVVDSVWSEARRPHRQKDSLEARPVSDGRVFKILKRYPDRGEIESLLQRHGFRCRSVYAGAVFIAALSERA